MLNTKYLPVINSPVPEIRSIKWYKRKKYTNANLTKTLELLAIKFNCVTDHNFFKHKKLRSIIKANCIKELNTTISTREIKSLCKIRNGKKVLIPKNTGKILMCIFNMLKTDSDNNHALCSYIKNQSTTDEFHVYLLGLFHKVLHHAENNEALLEDENTSALFNYIMYDIELIKENTQRMDIYQLIQGIEQFEYFFNR